MSAELPLKVRVGIRDQWDSTRAPITNSIEALAKTLGYTITPQIQWPSLYNALKDTFVEHSTFVPAICRVGIAFYGRMLSRLETEKRTSWIEKLLDELAKNENWELRIEASDDNSLERPRITWKVDAGIFYIEIPNRRPPGNSIIEAGFDEDLDKLISRPRSRSRSPPTSVTPPPELPKVMVTETENDWTEVSRTDQPTVKEIIPSAPSPPPPESSPIVNFLPALDVQVTDKAIEGWPDVNALARPARLFTTRTSYVLTVNARTDTSRLIVHCSHQATLEYLESYLKKWSRLDSGDSLRRPVLKVEMVESAFFSDVIDTMNIEPTNSMRATEPLNPTLILAFIEGILGYKETYSNGVRWVFKMDQDSTS